MATIYSAQIKSKFSNGVETQCKEKKCELKLTGFPPTKVILNVDRVMPKKGEKRCDRVIVVDERNDVFFLPIEFKSNNPKLSHVQEQLAGGTQFFQDYLPDECKFYPVLVSKKIATQERKKLRSAKVISKYGEKRIKHIQCNESLAWKDVRKQPSSLKEQSKNDL